MTDIDLNCDLGEGFGAYRLGMDAQLMPLITSANIACGWHAGDPVIMAETVDLAAKHNVNIGAHPGFPDRMGFGRRAMDCTPEEIEAYLIYQIGALMGFCRARGVLLRHVKPHGALYHHAVKDEALFTVVAKAVGAVDPNLYLVTLADKGAQKRIEIGRMAGIRVILEAFADRAYLPEGLLAPRTLPGAVITDPDQVARRVADMVTNRQAAAIDGTLLKIDAQTICVHGDSPTALAMIQHLRKELAARNIQISSIK